MRLEGATPFEKGLDFITHFTDKQFTTRDIQERYEISRRQADRIKGQVNRVIGLKPVGFAKDGATYLWEIGR